MNYKKTLIPMVVFLAIFAFALSCSKQPVENCKIVQIETGSDSTFWYNSPVLHSYKPYIKGRIKNAGHEDVDSAHVRVVFTQNAIMLGNPVVKEIGSIIRGYEKEIGRVQCEKPIFAKMESVEIEKWHYDLFISNSRNGPWRLIASGVVEIPEAEE